MENSKENATPAATSSTPQRTQGELGKKRYYALVSIVIGLSLIGFALMMMQYGQNQDLIEAYRMCDPNVVCKGLCAVGNVFG